MPNKKLNTSKKELKEEKSILELRPWEKDDYIPNPTASVYPYDYTPKFTKFGFLEIQPNELQLLGGAGFGFPKQGISADFVGTMPLKSNPFYKGSIGGGISKQLGDFNLGLNLSNQIAGYTDESGKFIQGVHDSEGKFIENKSRDLSKINPTIKLKYNFKNGGIEDPKFNFDAYTKGSSAVMKRLGEYHDTQGKLSKGDVYDEMVYDGGVDRDFAYSNLNRGKVNIPTDMYGMQEWLNKFAIDKGYDSVSNMPLQNTKTSPFNPNIEDYSLPEEYIKPSSFSEINVNLLNMSEKDKKNIELIRRVNSRDFQNGGNLFIEILLKFRLILLLREDL
jgi:hypothetical protein